MQCNSKTIHSKTMVLMRLLICIKSTFQQCITLLYLEELKKFLTSGQNNNPPFLKLQIFETRPTHGSFHPSFFVILYTYLGGQKRIMSLKANFYGIICQGLHYKRNMKLLPYTRKSLKRGIVKSKRQEPDFFPDMWFSQGVR